MIRALDDPAQESRDDLNQTRANVGLIRPSRLRKFINKRPGMNPLTPMTPPDSGVPGVSMLPNGGPRPVLQPEVSPTVPAPTQPTAPTYSPQNNLINKQINPTAPTVKPRSYQSLFGNGQVGFKPAATSVSAPSVNTQVGFSALNPNVGYKKANTDLQWRGVDNQVKAGEAINPQDTERFLRLGGQQDTSVNELMTGPNRTELAKRTLADFDNNGRIALDQRFREVGKRAAQFGRIGAGMTTNDLTGLQGQFERDRMTKANELAAGVAEGDINDRFRRVDTVSGLRGQEEGIYSNRRGEQRQERDYSTGLAERNVSRAQAERDAQLGLESQNLERQRAERDYEARLAAENYGRGTNERDTAMGLSERNLGRGMDDRSFQTGLAERNIGRGIDERNAGYNADVGNADRAFDRSRTAADYERGDENTLYNQLLGGRQEERGERDFQVGRSDKAQEDAIRQRAMEEALLNSKFQRDQQRTNTGFDGNPSGAYTGAGQDLGNEAAQGSQGAMELLTRRAQQTDPKSPEFAELMQAILQMRGG